MSVPDEVISSLKQLLVNLGSPSSEVRVPAEKTLRDEWCRPQQVGMLLVGLAQLAATDSDKTVRSFAAILFRRMALKSPEDVKNVVTRTVDTVQPEVRSMCRNILLGGFTQETDNSTRHKLCDAMAELVEDENTQGSWPQLVQTLFEGTQAPSGGIRESCFRLIATVPTVLNENQDINGIITVFQRGFADSDQSVQVTAVGAFTKFFDLLPQQKWEQLNPLLHSLLNVLPPLAVPDQGLELTQTLEHLMELAGLAPKMFLPVFPDLISFCVSIIENAEMDLSARLSALELLTTFVDKAPQMCKNQSNYTPQLVTCCLKLMTEIGEDDDDAAEWNNATDINGDAEEEEADVRARQSLDRLALKLHGNVILPPLFEYVPPMTSGTWKEKHAALMALSSVAEGCVDVMIKELSQVLDMVLGLLNDPHPRVQWAVCNTLGQISTDFAPTIQNEYHARVVPGLISILRGKLPPRVQTHAAAAMVNFAENATKEVLEPYLDDLLSSLVTLLNRPQRYLQDQVLTTISTIAESSSEKFSKYYDELMPLLLTVLRTPATDETRNVKAKSIECSSLIAVAVGKTQFIPSSMDLLKCYVDIQGELDETNNEDDPCQSHLVLAWSRICKLLGRDFMPFLDVVMPPLLRAASAKPDINLIEDEGEVDAVAQQEGWDVITLKGKHLSIHTAPLDDKAQAIELMAGYAQTLKDSFAPYVHQILNEILAPGIVFFVHDGVRYASASAIGPCLEVAKQVAPVTTNHQNMLAELFSPLFSKLIEAMQVEPMVDVLGNFYTAIYQAVSILGPNSMTPGQMTSLCKIICKNLADYIERVNERNADDNDYTEEDDDGEEEEHDEYLIAEINKCLHEVFRLMKDQFKPYYEAELEPLVQQFLTGDADQIQFSICVLSDVAEFCPESGPSVLQTIAPFIQSGDSNVRQAALYCVGCAAKSTRDSLQMLEPLFAIANSPDARVDENIYPTEHACCAIAKILKHHGSELGGQSNAALDAWVKTLPILCDEEVAPFAYRFLVELMRANHKAINDNAVHVLDSVAQTVFNSVVQGETARVLVDATKTWLQSLGEDQVQQMVQQIESEQIQYVVKSWFA
ncbi:armadillo-type protein [Yarrowia lipolytica]|uniref:YALI0F14575p n=3 Tax=Yarrowia lipolytica TaxID=4952 RepID=Q6C1P3_YARLI|nr:YALI0F14575p [Yarrowia lipolytica CLIB122]KAB8281700.1 armadillo-type protein [Yarrowia lipolytica]KAE8171921.1 armadillo-type protein [Yarrowia lipolytica]RDW28914.1 armadillo-type protein [Yarrowia lipolytica]RDW34644.1 armadillo-type protein [Yarrowia lipolytica]RDW37914.1 armadillo-type protein [Yarrowia lipolytica]|eukprot:XP_505419.1 YALI0F14575p [Yarrowia lipolytica CLIB122]